MVKSSMKKAITNEDFININVYIWLDKELIIGWTLTCETDEVKMFFTGALPPCGRFHAGHAPTGGGMV